jgi:hypothetical protein
MTLSQGDLPQHDVRSEHGIGAVRGARSPLCHLQEFARFRRREIEIWTSA